MLFYWKDHIWLSLLQAISHYEKTHMNTEKAFLCVKKDFLHVKTACKVTSPDLTVPEQDRVQIPGRHFTLSKGTLFSGPSPRTVSSSG